MRVDLGEFRGAYLAEVEEHLAGARARLSDVERARAAGRASPRATRELMRLLHTIKGLSAMVGVEAIVTIVHHMETVVRGAERRASALGESAISTLSDGLQFVEGAVRAVGAEADVPPPPPQLLASLGAVADGAPEGSAASSPDDGLLAGLDPAEREQMSDAITAGRRVVRIRFAPSADKSESGINITTVRERVSKVGDIVKVVPIAEPPSVRAPTGLAFSLLVATDEGDERLVEAAFGAEIEEVAGAIDRSVVPDEAPSASDLAANDAAGLSVGSLRVELGRVDDALERFSALVVNRARLGAALRSLRDSGADTRELAAIVQENALQMRELRAAILRLRMVPIETVLVGLPMMVRGLAKATGKDVELVLENGATELDKTVAEKLVPALLHLIRNAVDHGIESPAERRDVGKPPRAVVRVSATAQGGRAVEIRLSDDGRGIDRAAVAARANIAETLDDAALLDVICRRGLSTRALATTISGRGMGMDIVRKAITEELRGEILLETDPGRGTCFILRVPLTIAIVDGFTVMCGGQLFVVPVPVVEEIIELPAEVLPKARGTPRLLPRRGESVPVWDLAQAVGLPHDASRPARQALVVRRGRSEVVAFAVERVVHQQEAVVRPLDDAMLARPGIAGATDLGDGTPTIVLDLLGLFANLREAMS